MASDVTVIAGVIVIDPQRLRQRHGRTRQDRGRDPLSRAHARSDLDVAALAHLVRRQRWGASDLFRQSGRRNPWPRVAPLICYEQLLLWPILQSALHRPEAIVAIGNGWWATGTAIPLIQHASVEAWARLFGLCLVTAINR